MNKIIEKIITIFKVSISLIITVATLTLCAMLTIASLICRFIEGKDL